MNESTRYDTGLVLGADLADAVTVTDAAGAAADLSAYTGTFHVYAGTPDDPGGVAIEVSTANGRLTLGPGGSVERSVSAVVVYAALPSSDYCQFLWLTAPSGARTLGKWGYFQAFEGQEPPAASEGGSPVGLLLTLTDAGG